MSHEILSPFTDPVACRYNQWGDFSQWRRKGLVHCSFTEDSELITIEEDRHPCLDFCTIWLSTEVGYITKALGNFFFFFCLSFNFLWAIHRALCDIKLFIPFFVKFQIK